MSKMVRPIITKDKNYTHLFFDCNKIKPKHLIETELKRGGNRGIERSLLINKRKLMTAKTKNLMKYELIKKDKKGYYDKDYEGVINYLFKEIIIKDLNNISKPSFSLTELFKKIEISNTENISTDRIVQKLIQACLDRYEYTPETTIEKMLRDIIRFISLMSLEENNKLFSKFIEICYLYLLEIEQKDNPLMRDYIFTKEFPKIKKRLEENNII